MSTQGKVANYPDANLVPSNIKDGVSIFGVLGNLQFTSSDLGLPGGGAQGNRQSVSDPNGGPGVPNSIRVLYKKIGNFYVIGPVNHQALNLNGNTGRPVRGDTTTINRVASLLGITINSYLTSGTSSISNGNTRFYNGSTNQWDGLSNQNFVLYGILAN